MHLQIRAELHLARIRRHPPGQKIDQRRLARAVRPHDADAVPAHDPDRKIADHAERAVGLRDPLRVNHDRARRLAFAGRKLDVAGRPPRLAPLPPEIGKPRHAPDVALAPRGHAIAHPVLFHHDPPVELVLLQLFLFQHRIAPRLERGEPLLDSPRHPAIKPHRRARQPLEEPPIVADQHHRRPERIQLALQPLDRGQVEMVCRLVEQQNVRRGRQHPRQRRTPGLTARQPIGSFLARHPQTLEQIARAIKIVARREPRFNERQRRREPAQIRLLRQIAHRRRRRRRPRPPIRFHQPRRDLEQRRLARPIPSDQAQPLAFADDKLRP